MKNNTYTTSNTTVNDISHGFYDDLANVRLKKTKVTNKGVFRKITLLPFVLLTFNALPVQADELDTLQFRVGENIVHESNVFRLSDSTDPQTTIGNSNKSDTVAITNVGIKLNKSYSLQRVELDVSAEDHHYTRFSKLNFNALNYVAALRWSITPRLYGNVTGTRRDYVDTVADVQNTGQLNRRSDRLNAADAEYEIAGPLRLVGGIFERSSTSSLPLTFEGSSRVHGAEAGLRYVLGSGTSAAYRYKNGRGDYPDRLLSGQFAKSFKDREHEFRFSWEPTGKSTIQARVSQFSRFHDGLPTRDFSGVTGQVDASLAVTGKTSITTGLIRDLGSYQTPTTSYFVGNRFFVTPVWKPTEKTAVRLRYDYGVRDFKGTSGFSGTSRRDTTNIASLALEWQPIRALKLIAFAQQENRKSSDFGFNYKNASIGISGIFSF